ncbi:hypothetical protein D3C73_1273770 [compost metagenome]
MLADQVERLLHTGQHAERQHVDLHHFQSFDIVLVPFDHLAIFHGCRLDRHEVVEARARQHEAADMLTEVPWGPHQLAGKPQRHDQAVVVGVEVQLANIALGDFFRP